MRTPKASGFRSKASNAASKWPEKDCGRAFLKRPIATYRDLLPEDARFASAMLQDECESRIADLAARLDRSSAQVAQYRKRLIEAGAIRQRRRGVMAFELPFFASTLSRSARTGRLASPRIAGKSKAPRTESAPHNRLDKPRRSCTLRNCQHAAIPKAAQHRDVWHVDIVRIAQRKSRTPLHADTMMRIISIEINSQ